MVNWLISGFVYATVSLNHPLCHQGIKEIQIKFEFEIIFIEWRFI